MGNSILVHAAMLNVAKSVNTAYPLYVPKRESDFTYTGSGIHVIDTILSNVSIYGIIGQYLADSNTKVELVNNFDLGSFQDIRITFIQAAPISGWSPPTYTLNGTEIDSSGNTNGHASFQVSRTAIRRVIYSSGSGSKTIYDSMIYVIPA